MRSLTRVESLLFIVLAIVLHGIHPSIGRAEDELALEPYQVFVAEEEAFAHCGPSDEYYRTDPLRYGQTLDVYAETEDGWLGIRPPEDSFCWIPAETVELDPSGDQGTITEDRTVAWIGTHLGRARKYRWQVQLAKGEPVTVIGRSEREGPDGPQLWYRIVPPSGEYRWVHRDSVVMSSEELVASVRQQSVRQQVSEVDRMAVANSNESGSSEPGNATAGRSESGRSESRHSDSGRSVMLSSDDGRRQSVREEARDAGDARASEEDTFAASGESILNDREPIGSGLNETWRDMSDSRSDRNDVGVSGDEPRTAMDAFRQGGLLASLEFLTRPRIQEIGAQPETVAGQEAPHATDVANDSSWVAGASRINPVQPAVASSGFPASDSSMSGIHSGSGEIRQVSAQAIGPQPSSVSPAMHSFHVVPAERLAQIEAEVGQADLDRLSLVLSRLMAAQASAIETEVVERAARNLAAGSTDSITAGRARMLAETAERYRRIAVRRDGQSVLQTQATIPVASGGRDFISRAQADVPYVQTAAPQAVGLVQGAPVSTHGAPVSSYGAPVSTQGSAGSTLGSTGPNLMESGGSHAVGTNVLKQTGYLVQVYSARSNSPPFALTDSAGRTVAYVTPVPGVNLRTHLNSHINVVGTRGYLTGLNTPHIMVTQAVRTPE